MSRNSWKALVLSFAIGSTLLVATPSGAYSPGLPYRFSWRAPTDLTGSFGLELKLTLSDGDCWLQTYQAGEDTGPYYPVRYHQWYGMSNGGFGTGWLALMNRNMVSAHAANPTGSDDVKVESGSFDGVWFGGLGSWVRGPGTLTLQLGWLSNGFTPTVVFAGTPSEVNFSAPVMVDLECPAAISVESVAAGKEAKGFTQESMKGGASANLLIPGTGAAALRTFDADLESPRTITMLSSYVTGFGAQVGPVGVPPVNAEVTDVDLAGFCGDTHFTWVSPVVASSVNFYRHEGGPGSCHVEITRAAGWFLDLMAGLVIGVHTVPSLDDVGGTWQLIEPEEP